MTWGEILHSVAAIVWPTNCGHTCGGHVSGRPDSVCKQEGKITVCTWDVAEKNEQRFVFQAITSLLPEPPQGPGAFTFAEEGVLKALVEKGRLTVIGGGSTDAPYVYPDLRVGQIIGCLCKIFT